MLEKASDHGCKFKCLPGRAGRNYKLRQAVDAYLLKVVQIHILKISTRPKKSHQEEKFSLAFDLVGG